ncbi:MAG: TrpR-related protein YerC/YecD [Clostridia bacterium]|nr:TrpR-related protein YerC/YecD [Clostridia bacterium]
MGINEKDFEQLYKIITELEEVEDCKIFLADLCTFKELEQMAQRIAAAKLLLKGKTYEEVIKETDISSATLSRVSKAVKYGKGYKAVLTKYEN